LVVSRPGARRALAASGSTEEWFSAGGDAFWVGGGGAGEAWGGSEPVVASIGLTEGKGGRSSEPRTTAWSRVGDGDGSNFMMAALHPRRPGFGRLCRYIAIAESNGMYRMGDPISPAIGMWPFCFLPYASLAPACRQRGLTTVQWCSGSCPHEHLEGSSHLAFSHGQISPVVLLFL